MACARRREQMSKTILVVDDSAVMRRLVATHLRDAGYEVTEAVDGRDALTKLATTFDMLITDHNMPQLTGLQLIQIARTLPQYKHTPIIMLTTEADVDKQLAGRIVTCWMVKPVRTNLLLAAVQKLLSGPEAPPSA
jgi:two-component system chemotaxis response regulator CheY